MRRALRMAAALAAGLMLMAQGPAPQPETPLADPAAEARARTLFADIRCVVCQHESIADSPADMASDLRRLVREEVAAGRSDAEIREGLVRRYGDYILFTPPFRWGTLLLWLGPLVLLLGAGAALLWRARRRSGEATPLTAAEEADLDRMLARRPDLDASSPQDHP